MFVFEKFENQILTIFWKNLYPKIKNNIFRIDLCKLKKKKKKDLLRFALELTSGVFHRQKFRLIFTMFLNWTI